VVDEDDLGDDEQSPDGAQRGSPKHTQDGDGLPDADVEKEHTDRVVVEAQRHEDAEHQTGDGRPEGEPDAGPSGDECDKNSPRMTLGPGLQPLDAVVIALGDAVDAEHPHRLQPAVTRFWLLARPVR